MTERMPSNTEGESSIDQNFKDSATQWFNEYTEKSEIKDPEYLAQVEQQLNMLADPTELNRVVTADQALNEYTVDLREKKSASVSTALAALGVDNNRELFMQAADTVFTPSSETNPKAEFIDIVRYAKEVATRGEGIETFSMRGHIDISADVVDSAIADTKKAMGERLKSLGATEAEDLAYARVALAVTAKVLYRLENVKKQLQ